MTSQGSTFNVALVQLRSGLTSAPNLEIACKLIAEAKAAGADYVQTPEMTNILALKRELLFAAIVPEEQDPSLATFRELARRLAIHLHVGSLALKISPDKAANRSFLIDPSGDIVARYDKIHMFDVDLKGGESYRESRSYRAGDLAVLTDLPWGRLGLTICYDLRFPALYRALAEAGCSFLAIPSAFTKQTGEAHWHALIRARAWQRLGNLVGAGALALLVAGPWYLRNYAQLAADYRNNIAAAFQIEGDPPVLSASSLLYYFWTLVTHQLWALPFLLFVCGLLFLGRRQGALVTNRYPLLLIAGCLVAFTLVGNKDARFTMPMLPAVAVVATYWIDGLRPVLRRSLSGVMTAYCAGTFLAVSFGTPVLPRDVFITLPTSPFVSGLSDFKPSGDIVIVHGIRVWAQQSYPLGAPSDERWYQEEMFKEAARRSVTRTIWFQGPNVDTIWFNGYAMRYFALRYGVTWVATLPQSDFAAIRTLAGQSAVAPSGFEPIREFLLPDGGTLRLYRRV